MLTLVSLIFRRTLTLSKDDLPHVERVWLIRKSSKDDMVADIFNWLVSYSPMSACRDLVVFLRSSVKANNNFMKFDMKFKMFLHLHNKY